MAEEDMLSLPNTGSAFAGAWVLRAFDVPIEIGRCKHEC
jgi:hypothetical protein